MADTQTVAVALYRSVLGVFVPGVVALTPWFVLLRHQYPMSLGLGEFIAVGYAFGLALAAIVGSVCNGLGTWLESWFDARRGKPEILRHWWDYLSRMGAEPVGFRYLSRLFTSLSFELAMVTAAPVAITGIASILYVHDQVTCIGAAAIALIGSLIVGGGFCAFAFQTHGTICTARREILSRLPPSESDRPAEPSAAQSQH